MSLPVMSFPLLNFQQANPGLTAASSINQTLGQILNNQQQAIKNQYLGPSLQQNLLEQQYRNQLLGPQAAQGQERAAAELQQLQAVPQHTLAQVQEILKGNIPLEEAQRQQSLAQTRYLGAETGKTSAETIKLKQMQDIINSAYYGDQGKNSANATLGDVTTNQGPIVGTAAGIPVTGPQAKVLSQYGQSTQPLQPQVQSNQFGGIAPLTDQQTRLQRLADVQAALSGKSLPSMQPIIKQQEIQNQLNLKGKNDLLTKYSSESIQAQEAESNLNEWEKAYNATPTKYKGPWTPEWFSKQDPNAQVALKSGANLIVGELRPFFGGLGQLRVTEMNMLAKGTPSLTLSPDAAKEIVSQVRTALRIKQAKNSMAQKLSQFVDNPSLLESTISSAMMLHNPVDRNGNIDMSKMKDWIDYANPDFVNAVSNGRPETYFTEKDLKYTAEKNHMTIDQVINQIKQKSGAQ